MAPRPIRTIRTQLTRMSLAIVLCSTLLSLAGGLALTLRGERDSLDQKLLGAAGLIARAPTVSGALEGRVSQQELSDYLHEATVNSSDIDLVLVGDVDSVLLYAPDDRYVGRVYSGTVQQRVLAGEDAFTSDETGPLGSEHAAYAGVYSREGELVGFVAVGVYLRSLAGVTVRTVLHFLAIGLVVGTLGVLLALRLSRRIKDSLMGYEPDALARRFHQREDILDALEEGVLAIDRDQRVIFFNQAAAQLLQLDTVAVGKPLHTIYPQSTLDRILRTGRAEYNVSMRSLTQVNVLSDRLPLYEDGHLAGAVGIFRNRTEVTRLADDLTGVQHMVEAMRAYTHEFMNKLHVIAGLIQIGAPDRAQQYIMDTTRLQQEGVGRITRRIEIPAVAALLVGKTSRASELGIRLTLDRESALPPGSPWLPPEGYITILGNLIENAIEGLNQSPREDKEITVSIREEERGLLLCVEDNGPGIPVQLRGQLFQRGVSTKGEARGTGLSLVQEVVDAYRGEIRVESEPGVGTAFFISFRREEKEESEECTA